MESHMNGEDIDCILTKYIRRPQHYNLLIILGTLCIAASGAIQTSFHSLGSNIPYNSWDCTSSLKCRNATKSTTRSKSALYYNRTTICQNNLVSGVDFIWDFVGGDDASYGIQWGLYCNSTSTKILIQNMFFYGGVVGLSIAGSLYDSLGRRNSVILGNLFSIMSAFFAICAQKPYYLAFLRFFQGFGTVVCYSGVYIYTLELSPPYYRPLFHCLFMMMWPCGTSLISLAFYAVKNWMVLMFLQGAITTLACLPIMFGSDSPRFLLVNKNDKKRAKACLDYLICINKRKKRTVQSLTETNPGCNLQQTSKLTYLEFIRLHPTYMKLLVVQATLWFLTSFCYFQLLPTWDNIVDNIVQSSLLLCLTEGAAYIGSFPAIMLLGRKPTMIAAGTVTLISMVVFAVIKSYNALVTVIGIISSSMSFATIYLVSFELSPTSHRGRSIAFFQIAARCGTILANFSNDYFLNRMKVMYAIVACISLVILFLLALLPETRGTRLPNVPLEVENHLTVTRLRLPRVTVQNLRQLATIPATSNRSPGSDATAESHLDETESTPL